ncbi:MAG: 5'-nucleotidase [Lachnospiraceae bacterium]|nr:5'-nucleotidase [Lachnospiraceae bacterium]
MAYKLDDKMVIGVSSRALFNLRKENEIFEKNGVDAYCEYQIEHEEEPLNPGPGFMLIKSFLELNKINKNGPVCEVVIMSRNSPDTSMRVFNSIKYYGLDITRAVLTSGAQLSPYLKAFKVDLFLSAYHDDVKNALDNKIAAGIICTEETPVNMAFPDAQSARDSRCEFPIRIAFDGDAVIFDSDSEAIYQKEGLSAFEENERLNAHIPMKEGPFAPFLKKLNLLRNVTGGEESPIRCALVTARSAPAHERVIKTLRNWNVKLDEVFFLGGVEKKDFLKAFGAQIFFDDQKAHTSKASLVVPSALVPVGPCDEQEEILKII